jgi:hypothetical protein
VVATSGLGGAGYVAAFSKPSKNEEEPTELVGIVDAAELFPSSDGLMFGAGDLLVLATGSTLLIDGWNPFRRRPDHGIDLSESLLHRGRVSIDSLTEGAIDGSVAVFGVLVEMDEALLLIGVDGKIASLGEPVNWRCFPRSRQYLNQLHVTYDDHVHIYAYIDDYFVPFDARGAATRRPGHPQAVVGY